MDRFFLQKRLCTYKWPVKKQKTGRKTGKNPPKKVFFSSTSGQLAGWLVLSISGQAGYGHVQIRPNSASWPEGLKKNTFFGVFSPVFRPDFCFFTGHLYVQSLFCKKKLVHLTCSGSRSAHYKVPPRIGGCHFLLCQHTNTKDIAGQSARGTPPCIG